MNIKDIARLANVSVSTVSKIINKKDASISDETRERVLKIVKDYNYTPYSGIPAKEGQKSFLIGVVLDVSQPHESLGTYLVDQARRNGYAAIVYRSDGPEEELKNVTSLCGYAIDGVIWDRRRDFLPESARALEKKGVPVRLIDSYSPNSADNSCVDYRQLGRMAASCLIDHKHRDLICILPSRGYLEECFFQGVQMTLLENGLSVGQEAAYVVDEQGEELPAKLLSENTGVVCFSEREAARVYDFCNRKNRRIPKYLSVISLTEGPAPGFQPDLTRVEAPYRELAEYVCRRLVADMEGKRTVEAASYARGRLFPGKSVDVPLALNKQKIVAVGSINMDILIALETFPKIGETLMTENVTTMPGGKALNQAVGASRLGADVYLIGKVGKDYEGAEIFDYLRSTTINFEGVSHTSKAGTGRAYVQIQNNGESGIVIYGGANDTLSSQDISRNAAAFHNASFLLLNTEFNREAVKYAAQAAWNENVKILLKPSAVKKVSEDLIQKAYIFMPNERELELLRPSGESLEAKAAWFLSRGAKNVIVTLGSRGCYWSDGRHSQYFSAYSVKTVDTTGAADAFAATLVVYLTKGRSMEESIRCASCAAGVSTAHWGAAPAMIDQNALKLYLASENQNSERTATTAVRPDAV